MSLESRVGLLAASVRDKVNALTTRLNAEGVPAGGAAGQTLVKESATDRDLMWFGNPVLLIENGAAVPPGTPVGTVIFEKDA